MKIINALLSCPNDVYSDFYDEIYKAIDELNFYFENLLDSHIKLKHYLHDAYSEVGKPAQDHLDDTLIMNSDICLAFYYHNLGTKTAHYESGTDEEIHLMLQRGKHVALFWIKDEENDNKCEQRLIEYLHSNKLQCSYRKIIGKDNLKEIVKNDITNYFSNGLNVSVEKIAKPFEVIPFFKNLMGIDSIEKRIIALIESINKFDEKEEIAKKVFQEAKAKIDDNKVKELLEKEKYSELLDNISQQAKVVPNIADILREEVKFEDIFDDDSQSLLKDFVENHNLHLNPNFLTFNDEKLYRSKIDLNHGLQLDNCHVREKVENLFELDEKLVSYYSCFGYLIKFKNIIAVPLSICNKTTVCQGQLLLNLYLPTDSLVFPNKFRLDNKEIAEVINNKGLEAFFSPSAHYYDLKQYPCVFGPDVIDTDILNNGFSVNSLATARQNFDELFNYLVEYADKECHIKIEFNSLNPEEKQCLPTYIFVNKDTEFISYEITGSDLPRKIFGKIELKE